MIVTLLAVLYVLGIHFCISGLRVLRVECEAEEREQYSAAAQ